jgi:hypothetical protein
MTKKITIGLLAVFIVIQFFQPEKNTSDNQTNHISGKYEISGEVSAILKNACNDCHSNKTEYPWYANIQPVGWWLANHVSDGKGHLNFSEFTSRKIAYQNHKLEEIIEEVDEDKMPLPSYTNFGLHPEANLTAEQKKVLTDWAKTQMEMLKANYPADSLILRRPAPAAN